jgi:hypothetical protein
MKKMYVRPGELTPGVGISVGTVVSPPSRCGTNVSVLVEYVDGSTRRVDFDKFEVVAAYIDDIPDAARCKQTLEESLSTHGRIAAPTT